MTVTTRSQWIQGARPRTLPAAVAPVLVGTAIAYHLGHFRPAVALMALVVAVSFQVGANYANDYSDGIRGTDAERIGPVRLVGQGLAQPAHVRIAAIVSFTIGAFAGLTMVAISGWLLLLPLGFASIAAAWFYTGGRHPYGYFGLGEVFVFLFFGLVAVVGTTASQVGSIPTLALMCGVSCGALSCAILVANNLRDIPQDLQVGKRTLAVVLGDKNTRELYRTCILVAYAMPVAMTAMPQAPKYAFISLISLLYARRPLLAVASGASGRDLIPVLTGTGRMLLMFALWLSIGIATSPLSA